MSTENGSSSLGDRLNNWLRHTQPTETTVTRRADLNSTDPYAILGLPAHPAPDHIHGAYEQLREQFAKETKKLERITIAYQEICRRQGGPH
ncbi:MAG: hypothetical protein ACPGVU_10500 [Limisphaerales bacterium]